MDLASANTAVGPLGVSTPIVVVPMASASADANAGAGGNAQRRVDDAASLRARQLRMIMANERARKSATEPLRE